MSISVTDLSFYLQYKNKYVRALAWIIKSPMLLSQPLGKTSQLVESQWMDRLPNNWLSELDKNPETLIAWINKKPSYRLGIRFEALLIFLFKQLEQQGAIKNLHYNLPIYSENRQTLGELDIIYFDKEIQQRFHWENAVKFYLFQPQEYSFERWVGPNGGDWLQRKLEHLFTRQLGITNIIEAKMALSDCFTPEQNETVLNRMAFVKGILFKPLVNNGSLNHEEKQFINPQCQLGWWAYKEQFHLVDPEQRGKWRVVDKLDWIVPQVYPYQDDDMLKPNEMSMKIKYHFLQSKRSLMLALYYLDEISQQWVEQDRGMIVDRFWPKYRKMHG
ncbi:MAG: DUF1853 family protein [Pseudomonadota bacterium]